MTTELGWIAPRAAVTRALSEAWRLRSALDAAATVAWRDLSDRVTPGSNRILWSQHQTLGNLREPAAFPGWFRRIVVSRCHRILRRKRPPLDGMDELAHVPAGSPGPDQALQQRDMSDLVIEAINALPTPQREATALYYMNRHSQAEIADFLEVPVTTVKSRLHAARKRLKKGMVAKVQTSLERSGLPDGFTHDTVEKAVAKAEGLSREREYRAAEDILRGALGKMPGHPAAMKALNHAVWQSNISEEEGRWEDLPELVDLLTSCNTDGLSRMDCRPRGSTARRIPAQHHFLAIAVTPANQSPSTGTRSSFGSPIAS